MESNNEDHLGKVQSRATALVLEITDLSYPDRLQALRLTSMWHRCEQETCCKHTISYMDCRTLCQTVYYIRRWKVRIETTVCNYRDMALRQHYLSLRAMENWNSLPECVTATYLNVCKGRLDRHWTARHYLLWPLNSPNADIWCQYQNTLDLSYLMNYSNGVL